MEILQPEFSERYLGIQLSLYDQHGTELANRLLSAWRAFFKFKHVLCSRSYPLRKRLRLFESVVSPVALYACECWTLDTTSRDRLTVAWRKMLRSMFRTARGVDESYVEYIKRSTRRIEEYCATFHIRSWVDIRSNRKSAFAARTFFDAENKWSKRLLNWTPWFRTVAKRSIGRPRLRWKESLAE